MSEFRFEEATREAIKARIALKAISGGGKTYTALALMTWILGEPGPSMAKRIAMIDTERGSSRRYAKGRPWHFSVCELKTFEPEAFVSAIKTAADAGFEGVIVDSLSHEWAGTGGALEQADIAKRGGGNGFAAWGKITQRHNAVLDAIMDSTIHVIATMRTKTTYEQGTDEKGKKTVTKLGLQPVQRDGIEYEFDILGDLDADNVLLVEKSRCEAIKGRTFRQPGKDLAVLIRTWLDDSDAHDTDAHSKSTAASPASADARHDGNRHEAVNDMPDDAATLAMAKVTDLDGVDGLLVTVTDAGASEDDVKLYQRAACRRIIQLAQSRDQLQRAAALGKASGAPPEWHAKTKALYGQKQRDIASATAQTAE